MGDVFDDVEAIEDLNSWGKSKLDEADRLTAWGKGALALHARLREEVRSGKSLSDAANEARAAVIARAEACSEPPAFRVEETDRRKRGRGPDRQPRKPRGGANEMKEQPVEESKPAPSGNAAVLLDAFKDGPLTRAGIEAITGWTQGAIRDALDASPLFTTWTMQRDGDSEPVTVWGTTAQRDAYVNSIPPQTRARVPDAT